MLLGPDYAALDSDPTTEFIALILLFTFFTLGNQMGIKTKSQDYFKVEINCSTQRLTHSMNPQ